MMSSQLMWPILIQVSASMWLLTQCEYFDTATVLLASYCTRVGVATTRGVARVVDLVLI
jgi:hypothetical protein